MAEPVPLLPPAPAPVATLATVSVRDLRVAADIGVYAHEIGRRQPLILSVTLRVRAAEADRLEETVDYTAIVAYAERLAATRIMLIETFARRLAELCLAHPLVEEADVAVDKPGALAHAMAGTRLVLRKG